MPKVSVIIPTYNNARYLPEAIESVLAQTFRDFEIIVIDDGSTDHTVAALKPYCNSIIYLHQANQKAPAARNNGIQKASGEYLAFLDSDDCFLPDKLAAQVHVLDTHPEIGLVAGGFHYTDEAGHVLQVHKPWLYQNEITLESVIFSGLAPIHAVLLRRDWFDKVGGFDPHLVYCEDTDLWYRLALAGCGMVWERSIVCQYRLHTTNVTRSTREHFSYLRQVLDRVFADPRMPAHLAARKPELIARSYLTEASRLVTGGWLAEAEQCVKRALEIDPGFLADKTTQLAEAVVGLQSSVWSTSDDAFPRLVVNAVDQPYRANLTRAIATTQARHRFYTAFEARKPAQVRRNWAGAVLRDPSWLLNRGAWSMLGRSLLGFKD